MTKTVKEDIEEKQNFPQAITMFCSEINGIIE